MANIKTITKKLINNGYSENKLMMMTEKEIREAYKTLKEDSSMNKTIKVRRDSHESFESWIDRINKLLSSNGIHLDNNKLLTIIDDEETDCVSIEDELINVHGWCAGEPYYCYYDFNGNIKQYSDEGTNFEPVEVKEESTMKDNNTTVTNNSTNNKEEITMTNEMTEKLSTMNRTMQLIQILEWCDNVKNVHDAHYVKKDVLAQFLFDKDLIDCQLSKKELKKITRDELITHLRCTVNLICAVDNLKNADAITPVNTAQVNINDSNSITAGDLDITNDNAPESIEEPTFIPVEFNDGLATKILEKVIYQADTNKAHNFISDWMLTSIISELIIGLPLKDKGVEHYKTFTDEQKKNLAEIRKAFIKRAKLVAKYNNSKITGYYIPAKMLVWGRHKYLGVACVYRFMSGNKVAAEYHVSLNGIKNIATGAITALDDNAYATLDSKCVFVM